MITKQSPEGTAFTFPFSHPDDAGADAILDKACINRTFFNFLLQVPNLHIKQEIS